MKGSETITVVRTPKVDKLSSPSESAPAETAVTRCIILPRQTYETGQGWINVEGYDVYAPYGTDVKATDQVRARGKLWNVDGVPAEYINSKGKGKILLVKLKRS